MTDLPEWIYELVNAVEELEQTHPAGYVHPGSTDLASGCVYWALVKVPDTVRSYAAGFKAGHAAAVQEHEREPQP